MKHPMSFLGGCIAGALAMYFLDAQVGRRRRALVRDKALSLGHGVADRAQAQGERAKDRLQGVMATWRLDGRTQSEPVSDVQLHERIRARLGHLIQQPKAVQVEVNAGLVRLSGHLLRGELQQVLDEVASMPGVRTVQNALQPHDGMAEIEQWLSRQGQRQPETAGAG